MNTQQNEMSEEAKKARAEYQERWRRKNPHKQSEYMARYWQKKADAELAATRSICLYCGSSFEPSRSDAKYCSDRCRIAYNRIK